MAATDSVTSPDEATGSGEPPGPDVIVTVWGPAETCCEKDPFAVFPFPSLTVTEIVQVWSTPVRLAGATHAGAAAVLSGVKLPLFESAGQIA